VLADHKPFGHRLWNRVQLVGYSRDKVMASVAIKVCLNCETPLVPTMVFSGAEWFCMKCRQEFPLFNCERVLRTEELNTKLNVLTEEFVSIAKDCIPRGSRRADCAKCTVRSEYHLEHATLEQLERSKEAYVKLKGII